MALGPRAVEPSAKSLKLDPSQVTLFYKHQLIIYIYCIY